MRVALVHDFLIEYGGAERVLESLHEIWPKSPVYTAFYNPKTLGPHTKKFKNWKIITGWGTKLPLWQKLVSPYRVFSKSFFESFDLSDFDLVISSSNAYMAKAVTLRRAQGKKLPIHICYCHTPPRFLYGYPTAVNWRKNPILRPIGEVINHFMRVWDFEVAQRVDYFIANSKEVQVRIKKFYRRDSVVIYPPVDVGKFARGPVSSFLPASARSSSKPDRESKDQVELRAVGNPSSAATRREQSYFLVVSRLVGAKKVDLAVEVCTKLGLTLKVVGAGRELENLKRLVNGSTNASDYSSSGSGDSRRSREVSSRVSSRQARTIKNGERSTVDFLGEVSDEKLIALYQNCRAVIFPAEQEDFGLVPVEAMAAGKPVIANAQGGVLESVIDASTGSARCTGVYFKPATVGSLTMAINKFLELEKKGTFDPKFIHLHAQKFSKERFKREILKFVERKIR